jgi:uncharacterized repeat protein (TIGR01451 family)
MKVASIKLTLRALTGVFALVCAARAEDSPLSVSVVAERMTISRNAVGNEERHFEPITVLHEGEEVFYTLRIRNASIAAMSDATVVWPVPLDTRFVESSAAGPGADISFSVDGGRTFGAPGSLTVVTNGEPRAATAPDYTHIRWRLRYPLAAGAVALARFRVVFR